MNYNNKTALITGASSPLGEKISENLAKNQYNLILHYNNSLTKTKNLAKKLEEKYDVKCKIIHLDYLKATQKKLELFWQELEIFNVTTIVNSASFFIRTPLLDCNLEEIEQLTKINFLVPYTLSSLFAKAYLKNNKNYEGNIINILDSNIVTDRSAYSAYILAKKSLSDFTKIAALEFAPKIRVNGIAPSLLEPKITDNKKMLDSINSKIPISKNYQDRQKSFIQALLYLLQNQYVTGEILYIDGGEHLRR